MVRAWVLARARRQGEGLDDDGSTPLAIVAGLVLWLLRLSLAPRSTLAGFRSWVVTDCPVAPGLRPGHLAELEAARQDADQRIALIAHDHDEALEQAAATARRAHDEATRARAAETEIRAELQHVREDAARLAGHMRDSAATRIAALEEAATRLQAERDRLAADLRATRRLPRASARAPRGAPAPGSRAGRATKRDQMIELAAQRRDLASVPLAEVSQLASLVAAEIGYSPGTARRELVRYVRGLQAASAEGQRTPDNDEGSSDD